MLVRTALLGLALLPQLLTPSPARAQDSWSFAGIVDAGSFIGTRNLGGVVGSVGDFQAIQATGRLRPSFVVGAGMEATLPGSDTWFRLLARTTHAGSGEVSIALCSLVVGEICEVLEVDARTTSLHAHVGFKQGSEGQAARTAFFVGLGLRRYWFGERDCSPFLDTPDMYTVCQFMRTLFDNPPSLAPVIEIGFELAFTAGPATFTLRGSDAVSNFTGGAPGAEAAMQNDVYLTFGIGFGAR